MKDRVIYTLFIKIQKQIKSGRLADKNLSESQGDSIKVPPGEAECSLIQAPDHQPWPRCSRSCCFHVYHRPGLLKLEHAHDLWRILLKCTSDSGHLGRGRDSVNSKPSLRPSHAPLLEQGTKTQTSLVVCLCKVPQLKGKVILP